MPDDTAEGVKDRLARRFEGERDDPDDAASGGAGERARTTPDAGTNSESTAATTDSGSRSESSSRNAKSSKNAKNVKKEWTARSVYLPDELERHLSQTYKRLDWQLEADEGLSIKKTRHYYPLVVRLGLERIEEMESKELKERIESF